MGLEKHNESPVIDGTLTVVPLGSGYAVFTGTGGVFQTDPGFYGYDPTTHTLSVENLTVTGGISNTTFFNPTFEWDTISERRTGAGTIEYDDNFHGIGNALVFDYSRSASGITGGTETVVVSQVFDFVAGDGAVDGTREGKWQLLVWNGPVSYVAIEAKVVSGAPVVTINGSPVATSLSALTMGGLTWDATNSRLGINNATPEVAFHVVKVDGAASPAVTGSPTQFLFDSTITTAPAGANQRVFQIVGTVNFSTAPTSAKNLIACHYLMQTAANATDLSLITLRGAQSASTHLGSGPILNVYGGHQQANRSGTGNVLGTLGGHSFQVANTVGSGSVQQATAIHVLTPTHTAGATITDLAGLTIEDQTPAVGTVTNRRAINQKGTTDTNLFNGPVTLANSNSTAITQSAGDASTKLATTNFATSADITRDPTLFVSGVVVDNPAYLTSNRIAIQAAIDAACVSTTKKTVRLPAGAIYIDKPLWIWSQFVALVGDPNFGSFFYPNYGSGHTINIMSDEHVMPTLGTSLATGSGGALPIGNGKCYCNFWEAMPWGQMFSATSFTFRYFVKATIGGQGWHFFAGSKFATLRRAVAVMQMPDGSLVLYNWNVTSGAEETTASAAGVIPSNTTKHVAVVLTAGVGYTVWVGTPGATSVAVITHAYTGANPIRPRGFDSLSIGYDPQHGGLAGPMLFFAPEGWIDSFQVTRDAKYSSAFTAPTAKHSDTGDNNSAILMNFVVDPDVPRAWLGRSQWAANAGNGAGLYTMPLGINNDLLQMGGILLNSLYFNGGSGASAVFNMDGIHYRYRDLTMNGCYLGYSFVGATYGGQRDSVDGNTESFCMSLLNQAMQCDAHNGNLISNCIALVMNGAVSGSNNNINVSPLVDSLMNVFMEGGAGMLMQHCQVDDEGQSPNMTENVVISGNLPAALVFVGGLLVSDTAAHMVRCVGGATVQMFGTTGGMSNAVTQWVQFDSLPSFKPTFKGLMSYSHSTTPITLSPLWAEFDSGLDTWMPGLVIGGMYKLPSAAGNNGQVMRRSATIASNWEEVERVYALTDGATINTNAALGEVFDVTLGGNRTMAVPTNPVNGKRIAYRLTQDGTGSRTITWTGGTGGFTFTANTPPTLTTTADAMDAIQFRYRAAVARWDCINVVLNLNPPFDPTLLSGLKMWMAVDKLTGLSDGDPVSSATDSSGLGNHATQTSTARPLYKTGIVNSKPALLFDGTDDWLETPSFLAGTVFVVARYTGGTTFANYNAMFTSETADQRFLIGSAGTSSLFGGVGTNYVDGTATSTISNIQVFHRYAATATPFTPAGSNWRIGTDCDNAGRFWQGYMAEVIAYDRILTSTELAKVFAYLATKYAL